MLHQRNVLDQCTKGRYQAIFMSLSIFFLILACHWTSCFQLMNTCKKLLTSVMASLVCNWLSWFISVVTNAYKTVFHSNLSKYLQNIQKRCIFIFIVYCTIEKFEKKHFLHHSHTSNLTWQCFTIFSTSYQICGVILQDYPPKKREITTSYNKSLEMTQLMCQNVNKFERKGGIRFDYVLINLENAFYASYIVSKSEKRVFNFSDFDWSKIFFVWLKIIEKLQSMVGIHCFVL